MFLNGQGIGDLVPYMYRRHSCPSVSLRSRRRVWPSHRGMRSFIFFQLLWNTTNVVEDFLVRHVLRLVIRPLVLCDFPQRQAGRCSYCRSTCPHRRRRRFLRVTWCTSRSSPFLASRTSVAIDSESCGSSWCTRSGGCTERRRPVPPLEQVSVLRSGRQLHLFGMG